MAKWTLDDLFTEMATRKEVARSGHIPVQVGDYVVRAYDGVLLIFGQILDPMAHWTDDVLKGLPAEDRVKYEVQKTAAEEWQQDGYYFARWFSRVSPVGEMGMAHASTFIMTLTPEQFHIAREHGWNTTIVLPKSAGDA